VVAGNVPLDQAVQNALYTVELAGADVPVHAGRAAPLAIQLKTAQFVHGQDGMGDIGLPLTGRIPAPGDAVDVLVDTIRRHEPGALTLVTLGPLTNVAVAFTRDPSLATRLREIVIMGGTADAVGNVSAVAEFNIWVDPEAAAIVYGSGARITQVGWDISRTYATIAKTDAAALRALGSLGSFAIDINGVVDTFATEKTGLDGFDLPDPIAMAVALDADVATDTRRLNVMVETGGTYTAGQTVVDHLGITGREPNVHVVVEASRVAFLRVLHATLDERREARS
jgi:purine nucleosidase